MKARFPNVFLRKTNQKIAWTELKFKSVQILCIGNFISPINTSSLAENMAVYNPVQGKNVGKLMWGWRLWRGKLKYLAVYKLKQLPKLNMTCPFVCNHVCLFVFGIFFRSIDVFHFFFAIVWLLINPSTPASRFFWKILVVFCLCRCSQLDFSHLWKRSCLQFDVFGGLQPERLPKTEYDMCLRFFHVSKVLS